MHIPERDSLGRAIVYMTPFASKELDGKKLFKRVHGVKKDLIVGDTTIEFEVPYPQVKLNKLEVLWAPEGCTVEFEVLDTATNTISQLDPATYGANFKLNQFGFTAGISKDYYEQASEYDADMIQGMKIRCIVHSPIAKEVCVNFILNELK